MGRVTARPVMLWQQVLYSCKLYWEALVTVSGRVKKRGGGASAICILCVGTQCSVDFPKPGPVFFYLVGVSIPRWIRASTSVIFSMRWSPSEILGGLLFLQCLGMHCLAALMRWKVRDFL